MNLSHAYGHALDDEEAIKVIQEAYEYGYDFFVTAEFYVGRTKSGKISINEEIVGNGVKPFRDKILLATKFGIKNGFQLDSSKEGIRDSLEGSLARLQTDHIDLYYQHRIDPKVSPEEVASTMTDLIKEGKIRAWGITGVDEDYLRRANENLSC